MTASDHAEKIKNDPGLTEFQKKVLLSVLEIPAGEVRTYAWVASRVGSPRASRAVGRALSRNPYAPGVPCHRVIASDGSPGGYSGGTARKIELLERERPESGRRTEAAAGSRRSARDGARTE